MNIVYLVGNGFDIKAGLNTAAPVILDEFVKMSSMVPTPSAVQYLVQDIRNKGFRVWSDFEKEMGAYSSSPFVQNDIAQYLEAKAYFDEALIALLGERCPEATGPWVQGNASGCIGSLRTTLELFDQGELVNFLEHLGGIDNQEIVFHNLICFNYTPTLKRLYDATGGRNHSMPTEPSTSSRYRHILGEFCYAHGNIDGMPICGVDSIEQITNERFHDDQTVRQTIVKGDIQRTFGQLDDTIARELIDRANLICVYGMPFGSTDFRWWSAIAQRLASESDVALLIFEHDYRGPHSVPLRRLQETRRVKRIFLEAANLTDSPEKEIIEDKLFIAPASRLLPIKKQIEHPGVSPDKLREHAQRIYGSTM